MSSIRRHFQNFSLQKQQQDHQRPSNNYQTATHGIPSGDSASSSGVKSHQASGSHNRSMQHNNHQPPHHNNQQYPGSSPKGSTHQHQRSSSGPFPIMYQDEDNFGGQESIDVASFKSDMLNCLDICTQYIQALNTLCSTGALLAQNLTQVFSREMITGADSLMNSGSVNLCNPELRKSSRARFEGFFRLKGVTHGGTISDPNPLQKQLASNSDLESDNYYDMSEQFLRVWEMMSVSTAGASATIKTETLMTLQDIINKMEDGAVDAGNSRDVDGDISLEKSIEAAKSCLLSYIELQTQFSYTSWKSLKHLSRVLKTDASMTGVVSSIKNHFDFENQIKNPSDVSSDTSCQKMTSLDTETRSINTNKTGKQKVTSGRMNSVLELLSPDNDRKGAKHKKKKSSKKLLTGLESLSLKNNNSGHHTHPNSHLDVMKKSVSLHGPKSSSSSSAEMIMEQKFYETFSPWTKNYGDMHDASRKLLLLNPGADGTSCMNSGGVVTSSSSSGMIKQSTWPGKAVKSHMEKSTSSITAADGLKVPLGNTWSLWPVGPSSSILDNANHGTPSDIFGGRDPFIQSAWDSLGCPSLSSTGSGTPVASGSASSGSSNNSVGVSSSSLGFDALSHAMMMSQRLPAKNNCSNINHNPQHNPHQLINRNDASMMYGPVAGGNRNTGVPRIDAFGSLNSFLEGTEQMTVAEIAKRLSSSVDGVIKRNQTSGGFGQGPPGFSFSDPFAISPGFDVRSAKTSTWPLKQASVPSDHNEWTGVSSTIPYQTAESVDSDLFVDAVQSLPLDHQQKQSMISSSGGSMWPFEGPKLVPPVHAAVSSSSSHNHFSANQYFSNPPSAVPSSETNNNNSCSPSLNHTTPHATHF